MSIFFLVALLGYALDRVTKLWVRHSLPLYHSIPVLPPFLSWTHIENTGAAFSILNGRLWLFIAVGIIAGAVVVAAVWRNRKSYSPALKAVLGMLLAGICGNLTDRIFRHRVTDFIHVPHWPIFNVADSLVVVSVILLFLISFKRRSS